MIHQQTQKILCIRYKQMCPANTHVNFSTDTSLSKIRGQLRELFYTLLDTHQNFFFPGDISLTRASRVLINKIPVKTWKS